MEQQELQRIARLVELNRQKMARLEEQLSKLAEVRIEQLGVIAALQALQTGQSTMIPLGAGVQLPAEPADTVVIDIGSGVQAERSRREAVEILTARSGEVNEVIAALQREFDETERIVTELATTFTQAAEGAQEAESETSEEAASTPRQRRRRRGGELTLDD